MRAASRFASKVRRAAIARRAKAEAAMAATFASVLARVSVAALAFEYSIPAGAASLSVAASQSVRELVSVRRWAVGFAEDQSRAT